MKHLRFLPLALVAAFAITAAGCIQYIPHSISMPGSVDIEAKVVGRVEGYATSQVTFGIIRTGDDSLKAAVADALSKKGGDALVNVTVDRDITFFPHQSYPLYIKIGTKVTGTAVRL